jgi:transketolase
MIILNTIKGKGCAFAEGMLTSHNMPVTAEDVKRACAELN